MPVIKAAHDLWPLLPHPSPDHVVRVFARDKATGRTAGDYVRTPGELDLWLQMHCLVDCYIAPNPTTQTAGHRHAASDVTHWSYLLIDIDPIEKEYNVNLALDTALAQLGEWVGKSVFDNALLIDSGRGRQAWVRLDDLNLLDEGFMFAGAIWDEECQRVPYVCGATGVLRSTVRRVMGYWLRKLDEYLQLSYENHGCRVDTSTSDLPRLMRCPGSTNFKTGKAARILRPSEHVFRGMGSLLIAGTPKREFIDPEVKTVPGRPWQEVFPNLTRLAQKYLTFGWEEPGRHKTMWHTARVLAERGCDEQEARKAIVRANSLRGPESELKPEDIDHALKTAYRS